MKDNRDPQRLGERLMQFAKDVGCTMGEAYDYIYSEGKLVSRPKIDSNSSNGSQAEQTYKPSNNDE
jgi:hypothetical protein